MKILFILLISSAFAGRPVFHEMTRNELLAASDFVFLGWPSPRPATIANCPAEVGRWQIHRVFKGDKSLEGKIVSIAEHRYSMMKEVSGQSKGPSYAAQTYKGGTALSFEATSSILFTNKRDDGCFELAANGAQEHHFKEAEIDALTAEAEDCEKASRGFESRLGTLPRDCQKGSDCKIFNVNPNPWQGPLVLSKKAQSGVEDEEFKTLQAKMKSSCAKSWGQQPPLYAADFPFRCVKNVCQKGMDVTLLKKNPVVFSKGSIGDGCAPHDAPSKMITLSTDKGNYPMLVINWWGEKGKVVTDNKHAYERGMLIQYCHAKRVCPTIKRIELELNKDNVLDFHLKTEDGENLRGKLQLNVIQYIRPVICG